MNKFSELKVCYVGSPPLFTEGASAIHMMKMCQAMINIGIKKVELVLPSYNKTKDIYDYYGVKNRFKIISIPFTNFYARQIVHGIASAIYASRNRKNYDLFLTRNIVFTFISTVILNIPTIYDAHHPPVNFLANYLFKQFKDSKNLIRFSTNTQGLGEIYLKLGLDKTKHVVAHNGVDLDDYKIDQTVSEIRSKLNLPNQKKIVCYSGNTYKGRGIESLIEIASELKDAIFLIVGGTEDDNSVYKKVIQTKGLDNFIIKGFVSHDQVPLYLKASDILVIPYTTRVTIRSGTNASNFTSPIKLFEYMASGKPIVATSIPTIKEVLKDRSNAVLVEADNIKSLKEGISLLLKDENLGKTISENALSDIEQYTWEGRVRRILSDI